jgi:hypothetical protein
MRLMQLAGVALTLVTLGAAPSFAQERYVRHDEEQGRVSSRRPAVSLSIVIGNPRPSYYNNYRRSGYDGRSYSYSRSSRRSCSRNARVSYGYDRSYGSRYSDRRDDGYVRSRRNCDRY